MSEDGKDREKREATIRGSICLICGVTMMVSANWSPNSANLTGLGGVLLTFLGVWIWGEGE